MEIERLISVSQPIVDGKKYRGDWPVGRVGGFAGEERAIGEKSGNIVPIGDVDVGGDGVEIVVVKSVVEVVGIDGEHGREEGQNSGGNRVG